MITFSDQFEANLLAAVKEGLGNKDPGLCTDETMNAMCNAIMCACSTFLSAMKNDYATEITKANDRIQDLSDKLVDQEKVMGEQAQLMVEQTKLVSDLTHKVTRLEQHYRTSEVHRVRDNVVIKTSKGTNDIGEFLADTIKKGCGEKPSLHLFSIQLIMQKKGDITPGRPRKGKQAESQLYKVRLSPKMKNDLYRGLALSNGRTNDFQVSHDTPRFLVQQKHAYEKIGYSIRSTHKKTLDVKTRISLRSNNLSLTLKTKDSDWFDLESELGKTFLDTQLVLKDGDAVPNGVVTVDDLKKTIVNF